MISDNYVTGDNIYLRELQNFFFEVLGMMSVTHYGAIGDGRTDCYGPLQVAIDDAKRRKLSYIYVPMGRYIYTGELINMDGITFIGNPHAKIINIRTCEEIPIKQFGASNVDIDIEMLNQVAEGDLTELIYDGEYINLSNVQVGDVLDTTPIEGANTAYYIGRTFPGEKFDLIGDFDLATLDYETKIVLSKYSGTAPDFANRIGYTITDEGAREKIFVVSFKNTDQYTPSLVKRYNFVLRSGDTMTGSLAIGGTANGNLSFAQGSGTSATSQNSHAEGYNTTASADSAHAEGIFTTASATDSHAEGEDTRAINPCTHAEGLGTVARGMAQHTEGAYNVIDTTVSEGADSFGTYLHILGNGQNNSNRSNAHTIDKYGNGWFAGDVYVYSTSGTNMDAGSKKLATEEYVNDLISQIEGTNRFLNFIAPTTWDTQVSLYKEYTTTDGYGLWRIYASSSKSSNRTVIYAFDRDDDTTWGSDGTSFGDSVYLGMDFPVLIKPTELRIKPSAMTSSTNQWTIEIQGKHVDDSWEPLYSTTMPETQTPAAITPTISTSSWFKGFRAILTRPHGASSTSIVLDDLSITKGYWKEMT